MRRRAVISLALAAGAPVQAGPRRLLTPRPSGKAELSNTYPALLLEQAMAAAGEPATLDALAELIPQDQALQELSGPRARFDVLWSMTSVEREQQVLPVRVPIFKGLYGWRLLLARPELAARLSKLRTLAELRQVRMVQGRGWPDADILRHNGVPVSESASYYAMFSQVRLNRADAFPRSVEEIWWEQEKHGQGLVIVPDICLRYPAAVYYFVSPSRPELAATLALGLQRLRASGEFERLFIKHHGDELARARLGSRHVIALHNPLLPPLTPLDRPELWYRP
jgi:hypothetical protein